MLVQPSVGSDPMDDFSASRYFASAPIHPIREAAAYESLWLGDGVWFKHIADLFRANPGALPSELVPASIVEETLAQLTESIGRDRLNGLGIRVHGAGEYPAKLRDADHPLEILYYRGNWELVDTSAVAVVGTRNPSPEGAEHADRIARALVRNNYTVVSGLAKGIDTAALRAAIDEGGRVAAVVGTSIFESYPKENAALQEKIARDFLLVSQVPFLRYARQHYKANSLFFPARNVTMSALTKATIIVEAGNTSGTLVQARAALAQRRKLLILDSCFRNASLTWPSKYERAGAIRVKNISEIMDVLGESVFRD